MKTKHIICYSGGHSSAQVAIEVVRKFGRENCVLVNHDMHSSVEDHDIKRFKNQVADYLSMQITYVNYKNASMDQFDVCVEAQAFKVNDGRELCTNRLKTRPFMNWLESSYKDKNVIIYYGFDANEKDRIQRRSGILGQQGYKTDYPLALWTDRTIEKTLDIGIPPPATYSVFKHGNCIGCLKAGQQHWYIVYCTRPDIWLKGKWAEEDIGFSIIHTKDGPLYLEDLESKFEEMKQAGIQATELMPHQTFWAQARKHIKIYQEQPKPCECSF